MRKQLLLVAFAGLLTLLKTNAQDRDVRRITVDLKVGLAISSFTQDVGPFDGRSLYYKSTKYAEYEKTISGGVYGGVGLDYNFTNAFSVGTGLHLIGRGSSYRVENQSVTAIGGQGKEKAYNEYIYNINYLEVPVLAQYDLGGSSKAKISFIFYSGLIPAFLTGAKITETDYERSGAGIDAKKVSTDAPLEHVRPFNLSSAFGVKIGNNRIAGSGRHFADLRIAHALLPVFSVEEDQERRNLRTGMWTASVAIGLRLN